MRDDRHLSDELITKISNAVSGGGAICLLGAGFSLGGTDCEGRPIPSTSGLADELMLLAGLDKSEAPSLTDIADFCDLQPNLSLDLRKLLIGRLTLTNPTDYQKSVVGLPWRSIFTTNFDDLIESCCPNGRLQLITPSTTSVNRIAGKTPLYYLHGRAMDLVESNSNPNIVLSERNYLEMKENNRALYDQLRTEIICANQVFLIGYSIKDLDIARIILGDGQAFKDKTIIVCSDSESEIALSRLSKFGQVVPIGVSGFSDLAQSMRTSSAGPNSSYEFLRKYEVPAIASEIEVEDFQRLLLAGLFEADKYLRQISSSAEDVDIYSIRRSSGLDLIINRPIGGLNRFIISSDYGNGKTIFIEQLSVELSAKGLKVWRIETGLEGIFEEIERALGEPGPHAFLIDDVVRYRNVAAFIGPRLGSDSIIVCCVRGEKDERATAELEKSLAGAVRTIGLNQLTTPELEQWNGALERWGLWEEKIAKDESDRFEFLRVDCSSENRSIVLSIFRNSEIAKKIDYLVDFFLHNRRFVREFAGLLISSLCQRHVSWESMVAWLKLDQEELRKAIAASEISGLFHSGRNWTMLTSSQLADHILHSKFLADESDVIVEVYSSIVRNTASSASNTWLGRDFRENLKELVKFRFLTRLFGSEADGVNAIGRVYKILSKSSFVRTNDQFWLQYAMSRMEIGDLENAQSYIKTALGIAGEKGVDYSPFQILDQRARLFFIKNSKVAGKVNLNEISIAVDDLISVLGDRNSDVIYVFRSAALIDNLAEMQISYFSPELKAKLIDLVEKVLEIGRKFDRFPGERKGETKKLRTHVENALLTLRFAE